MSSATDGPKPSLLPRPSGIPRISRLPQPASTSGSIPSQSKLRAPASNDNLRKKTSQSGLNSHTTSTSTRPVPSRATLSSSGARKPPAPGTLRPSSTAANAPKPNAPTSRRVSGIGLPRSTSTNVKRDDTVFKKPFARPPSRQAQPTRNTKPQNEKEDVLGSLDGFRASSRQGFREDERSSSRQGFRENERASSRQGFYDEAPEPFPAAEQIATSSDEGAAKPKKSRPSLSDRTIESLAQVPASPNPRRRRSSFFSHESPMQPPSQTSRPPSRSGSAMGSRPGSSDGPKTLATPSFGKVRKLPAKPSLTAPQGRRSISAMTPKASPAPSPIRSLRPSASAVGMRTAPNSALKPRASASNLSNAGGLSTPLRPKAGAPRSPALQSPDANDTEGSARKVSNSSAALREQIAKAKAARKAAATKPKPANNFSIDSPGVDVAEDNDPFNQLPKGGDAVLRKRVHVARSSGRLNIAALGLTEIPDVVMKMYDFEANKDSNIAWSEAVDLERFNAADNDLERIADDVFPDIDEDSSYIDEDRPSSQFGGIHILDLHGNMLSGLPRGLRKLPQLQTLNLSRNRLTIASLELVTQISSLKELKLADNMLKGVLPSFLGQLSSLQTLDLQGNELTELPNETIELSNLRILNVANNKIRRLPMENLMRLSLTEIVASNNDLQGVLFSTPTAPNSHLQILNVRGNSLTALSYDDAPSLPHLKVLDISTNRIASLPSVAAWEDLVTLLAAENKLSVLPEGFTELQSLKSADFSSNDIAKIDDRIALMDSLENLSLAANPIRDRKYLTMNTADLKQHLRGKVIPADNADSAAIQDGESPDGIPGESSSHGWSLSPSGTLDLSRRSWTELLSDEFTTFANTHTIKQLSLSHNSLTTIPSLLLSLTPHLTALTLSSNNISSLPLSHPLTLPHLRDLQLANNKLTLPSLTHLCSHLTAPHLSTLNLTNNSLTGTLPSLLVTTYPSLLVLLLADNALTSAAAESLRGLRSVDLRNNSIERLDLRIGLLQGVLTSLEVEGNIFKVPGWQVVRKGTEGVLGWCRGRLSEEELEAGFGEEEG